ncbi:uncharacterized protein PFLUO_LOCUS9497 [Penicillium psychrofluorescens]|uniref:uncharacterized protein n=1 Tax=Penicillium psychrofluorescens TaxID=3158075 RepID=UPI003CCE0884
MPPPAQHTLPLTLIVATTPIRLPPTPTPSTSTSTNGNGTPSQPTRLGIGHKGTLPWPRIKADMSFFARVTSRPPAPGTTNAIIMGRKTYDSVPVHLRPLAKRINVVITRDKSGAVAEGVVRELEVRRGKIAAKAAAAAGTGGSTGQEDTETKPAEKAEEPITDAIVTRSLDDALTELQNHYGSSGRLGKIYIIGGAEIYAAALARPSSSSAASTELSRRPIRVVMTNVARKRTADEEEKGTEPPSSFDCDTFFPVDELSVQNGWRSVSKDEVSEWVGEEVSGEWKEDGEVEIQMVGFEKV